MMYIFKELISIVVMLFAATILLTSHVSDGNVWGIYLENGHLLIGDFWSAVAVIALFSGTLSKFKAVISYITKLTKEQ